MSLTFRNSLAAILVALVSLTSVTAIADGKKITAKGDKCVEPTDIMRRNHMDFILHQRDDTMRRGIRTSKHSLKECINCHADPKTNSVLGEDGFCAGCHQYTAVSLDCFGCHNDKAETKQNASGIHGNNNSDNVAQDNASAITDKNIQ